MIVSWWTWSQEIQEPDNSNAMAKTLLLFHQGRAGFYHYTCSEFKGLQSVLLQKFRGKEEKSVQTLCFNLNVGKPVLCKKIKHKRIKCLLDLM